MLGDSHLALPPSHVRHLFKSGELLGLRLNTVHNLHYFLGLFAEARQAITRFDRVGAGLERDPQQLIFGGTPAVRDYNRR